MPADLQDLEARLGHVFRNRDLLVRALTHRSFSREKKVPEQHPDNEQFEFFGDAILGFLVSERLVTLYPASPEGRLSKLKNRLVSADRLHEAAQRLELGSFLNLGRGEEMGGGRVKRSLLANGLEAIIAAVYLDGGIAAARELVSQHVIGDDVDEKAPQLQNVNYKGELEERVHLINLPRPNYTIVEETGPGHAKVFIVEVKVGDRYAGRGTGSTKKSAAQEAAKSILEQMDGVPANLFKLEA
jgi:ribonuclease-3